MKTGTIGQSLDSGKREKFAARNNYIISRSIIYTLKYILLCTERKHYETRRKNSASDGNKECIQKFGRKVSQEDLNSI